MRRTFINNVKMNYMEDDDIRLSTVILQLEV